MQSVRKPELFNFDDTIPDDQMPSDHLFTEMVGLPWVSWRLPRLEIGLPASFEHNCVESAVDIPVLSVGKNISVPAGPYPSAFVDGCQGLTFTPPYLSLCLGGFVGAVGAPEGGFVLGRRTI
jgi:hypothetical protein